MAQHDLHLENQFVSGFAKHIARPIPALCHFSSFFPSGGRASANLIMAFASL
jgi:hypothetical protein